MEKCKEIDRLTQELAVKETEYETLMAQEENAHYYCKNCCEPRYKEEIKRLKEENQRLKEIIKKGEANEQC